MKKTFKAINVIVTACIYVISVLLFSFILAVSMCAIAAHAYGETPQKTLVIGAKTEKGAKTATEYRIQKDGKTYIVYRGPKGGYFYLIGEKKIYLTKSQKEKLGITK